MAIASDYWEVVADALCDVRVDQNFVDIDDEPDNEFQCSTKYLIDFEAVIRRVTSCDADRLSNLDDVISRTSVTKASIQLESSKSHKEAAVSDVLRELKVPLSERDQMVRRIISKAGDIENERRKTVHMLVIIDLIVVDDNSGDDEDGIIVCCVEGSHPYPDRSMIEQLQKTGVCPMCDDERKVFVAKMENQEILPSKFCRDSRKFYGQKTLIKD